ncbi:hypothetical protein HT665_09025 [Ursidibacter maritimus]|uniref:Factor H binding protein-like C-terminal domain-containing protein n=1 Tax=Ursidibacter maritimus TaxID=1331689 RepID=A0A949WNW0_9PAST|nr:factor H binding protein domain-containing protein [Ursidibacter maritimus]KAE9538771.1 hypothetical protein A1D26_05725 [Ursidibacter maritimus]MBV6523392.1 hypothetical protein [Ursidibacter maritimus]MBV6526467.1 hypothetical protein [Ursidibacter maritimus]MBV6527798.1 hypothetical protein [Ursidibacter maritimus]MBV6529819.1 hypothetical protein [Ursidibacter maritimus]
MKLTKIALALLTTFSLVSCGSSDKEREAKKAEKPVTEPPALIEQKEPQLPKPTLYQNGDGKRSLSYVPEEYKNAVANLKYGYFKVGSLTNNGTNKVTRIDIDGKNLTELTDNIYLVDENIKLGLANYKAVYYKEDGSVHRRYTKRIYNLPYSTSWISNIPSAWSGDEDYFSEGIFGMNPSSDSIEKLSKEGKIFTYKGVAFTLDQTGKFNYTVDFGEKIGQGEITGLAFDSANTADTIKLQQASLDHIRFHNFEKGLPDKNDEFKDPNKMIGFKGKTDLASNNIYLLALKGPNAEEITGTILKSGAEYQFYSPTQDMNNSRGSSGKVSLIGCRDSELCQ